MEKTFMILDTHICMGNQGSLYNQELRIYYYQMIYSEFSYVSRFHHILGMELHYI